MDEIDYFADDVDLFAGEPVVPRKKFGPPAARKVAAEIVRGARALFPSLHGGWSRKEWNYQVRLAARNYIRRYLIALKQKGTTA